MDTGNESTDFSQWEKRLPQTPMGQFILDVRKYLNFDEWVERIRPLYFTEMPKRLKADDYAPFSLDIMIKSVLLAYWFNMNDGQIATSIDDFIPFRCYLNLFTPETPSDYSIKEFRALLKKNGLWKALLEWVTQTLKDKQLVLKRGSVKIADSLISRTFIAKGIIQHGDNFSVDKYPVIKRK